MNQYQKHARAKRIKSAVLAAVLLTTLGMVGCQRGGAGASANLAAGYQLDPPAAGEQIAVLHTSLEHNQESIDRIRRELADTENRAGGLQSQVDEQLQRIAQIDENSAVLERELEALLHQAQQLADSAAGARSIKSRNFFIAVRF